MMDFLLTLLNYVVWYLFVFIGVVWILVMVKNREPDREGGFEVFPGLAFLFPLTMRKRPFQGQ